MAVGQTLGDVGPVSAAEWFQWVAVDLALVPQVMEEPLHRDKDTLTCGEFVDCAYKDHTHSLEMVFPP